MLSSVGRVSQNSLPFWHEDSYGQYVNEGAQLQAQRGTRTQEPRRSLMLLQLSQPGATPPLFLGAAVF